MTSNNIEILFHRKAQPFINKKPIPIINSDFKDRLQSIWIHLIFTGIPIHWILTCYFFSDQSHRFSRYEPETKNYPLKMTAPFD